MFPGVKKIFVFSFLAFLLAPFSLCQAADVEEISQDTEWSGPEIVIGNNVIVNFETTLKIAKGVKILFKNGGSLDVQGTLLARGTAKEPVHFSSADGKGYSIAIEESGRMEMNNVEIEKGGIIPEPCRRCDFQPQPSAAIENNDGILEIYGSNIHDNSIAIKHSGAGEKLAVNRSRITDNGSYDFIINSASIPFADLRFNWWGSADGPEKIAETARFKKIAGSADVSYFAKNAGMRDPVIVIPGILGSQEKDGVWIIDPVFHTADNLIAELVDSGYAMELDLFPFAYDWRDSNGENAKLLKQKIEEIKEQRKWPKVDIVAHSMGGLVARSYIQSGDYAHDIDQLITLGTPHHGSPEDYLVWEAGEEVGFFGTALKQFFNHEAKEKNYADVFDYLRNRPVKSIEELLPDYAYLKNVETEKMLDYPLDYPRNILLENLNDKDAGYAYDNLRNIEFSRIIGNLHDDNSTVGSFEVMIRDVGKKWKHGYPISFEIPIVGNRGGNRLNGDGTVPLSSARADDLPGDYAIELDSDHKNLMTNGQLDVVELLTGKRPSKMVEDGLVKDVLIVNVYSPVDIRIIDPEGNMVGKDFQQDGEINQIPGAYYSGFKTNTEFITIPNPKNGTYTIVSKGTGNGGFAITVTKISEGNTPLDAVQSEISFSGSTSVGEQKQFTFSINGAEVSSQGEQAYELHETNETEAVQSAVQIQAVESNENRSDRKGAKKKKKVAESIQAQLQPKQSFSQLLKDERGNSENILQQISEQKGDVRGDETLQSATNQTENQPATKNLLVLALQYLLAILLGYVMFKKFIAKD